MIIALNHSKLFVMRNQENSDKNITKRKGLYHTIKTLLGLFILLKFVSYHKSLMVSGKYSYQELSLEICPISKRQVKYETRLIFGKQNIIRPIH